MSTESLPEHLLVALQAGECLDRHGIAHMFCGSIVSSIHGEPRSTYDIDMIVDLSTSSAAALLAALEPDFFVQPAAIDMARATTSSCNAVHRETAIRLDIFMLKQRAFSAEEFARRTRKKAQDDPDRFLCVTSPEDMILAKLEWFRKGDEVSDRQWRDVLGMLKLQGNRLDEAYLRKWSSRLGIEDLLLRARGEPG